MDLPLVTSAWLNRDSPSGGAGIKGPANLAQIVFLIGLEKHNVENCILGKRSREDLANASYEGLVVRLRRHDAESDSGFCVWLMSHLCQIGALNHWSRRELENERALQATFLSTVLLFQECDAAFYSTRSSAVAELIEKTQ
jgi:hypothetical protein